MNELQAIKAKTLNLNCYLMAAETKCGYNISNIERMPLLDRYYAKSRNIALQARKIAV